MGVYTKSMIRNALVFQSNKKTPTTFTAAGEDFRFFQKVQSQGSESSRHWGSVISVTGSYSSSSEKILS